MRQPKQILYLGTHDEFAALRRMQFRVRPEYKLIDVRTIEEAMQILAERDCLLARSPRGLDLVMVEYPLRGSARDLIHAVHELRRGLNVLVVSEFKTSLPHWMGADQFWSHQLHGTLEMFTAVRTLSRRKAGPRKMIREERRRKTVAIGMRYGVQEQKSEVAA